MNILFVHGNYPAQFNYLARFLASYSDNRVVFLTARQDADKEPIQRVEIRKFMLARDPSPETHHYLQATEKMVLHGQAVVRAVSSMIEEGFLPNLVVCHAGNGLSMYLKDLIPGAKIIGLFEWWFLPQTSKWLFSDFTFDTQLKTQTRNLVTQHELQACDAAVVPTAWQAQQFPAAWENHIKIIFDGINSSFFFPPVNSLSRETELQGEEGDKIKISSDQLLLSYATRGMEPLRGFPQFMHALPELLDYYPNLHVVIAGRDRCVYSYPSPAANGSWKEYCLELEQISGHRRVHFTGLLPYAQYRKLLWRSDCHCSFSRPYVLSWSLFESLGCGTPLVVNDTEAHRSVVHESAAQWVDLDNSDAISEAIRKVLDQDVCERFSYLSNSFSLESCLTSWVSLIKEIVG